MQRSDCLSKHLVLSLAALLSMKGTKTAMTHYFDSKLPHAGTTIFTVMSQMAADHGAINLSQGFPDFDGPEPLKAALRHYVDQGLNQYAPLAGVRELREQIALKVEAIYGHTACPEKNITVVPGATEAIYCAIQATVRHGDEVIVFDPAYDSYQPSIELAGGKAVHVPLSAPDFQVDWQRVKDAVNANTRMIIINTPHNPTGTVWSAEEMRQLSALISDSSILLLSDEVYEPVFYRYLRDHEMVVDIVGGFCFEKKNKIHILPTYMYLLTLLVAPHAPIYFV